MASFRNTYFQNASIDCWRILIVIILFQQVQHLETVAEDAEEGEVEGTAAATDEEVAVETAQEPAGRLACNHYYYYIEE